MDYQTIQMLSGLIGLFAFVGVFTAIVIWVYRPGAKEEMKQHGQIPLKED